MNRDEAIDKLQRVKCMRTVLPETKEAIDIAINSLKQEWSAKDLASEIAAKDEMLRVLFNRCEALIGCGSPGMCNWCGISNECHRYRSVGKSSTSTSNYIFNI